MKIASAVAGLLLTVIMLLLAGPSAHAAKSCPGGSSYMAKTGQCIDIETGEITKEFRI